MKRSFDEELVARLEALYPEALCGLHFEGEPWKLLVMSRLSAQCTDKRVNEISLVLFERYPTLSELADCDLSELEEIVRPCGLFRTKARDIKAACEKLRDEYDGILPDDIDTLLTFPGVGRKIANLIVGDVYGKPAIVADTHCMRLAGRFGYCEEGTKDAPKVERILKGRIAPDKQNDFCHRLVLFGRDVCRAQRPLCEECPLRDLCRSEMKKKA